MAGRHPPEPVRPARGRHKPRQPGARPARAGATAPSAAADALAEDRRGLHDPGLDSALEVALDPRGDRVAATVALELIQVEAELLGTLPKVGVIEVALVGEQRVVHLPEAVL